MLFLRNYIRIGKVDLQVYKAWIDLNATIREPRMSRFVESKRERVFSFLACVCNVIGNRARHFAKGCLRYHSFRDETFRSI